MTTPYQGPGMWEPGNREQFVQWGADLSERDQIALRRAIALQRALAPIINAAVRVEQVAVQTYQRLSEGARSLASQTAQFGRDTATRAGEIRDNTVDRVADFGQRVQVRADLATQVVNERLDAAGRAITAQGRAAVEGAQNLGRNAVQTGRNTVEGAQNLGRNAVGGAQTAGRNAVQAGRNTADRMSRWLQDRRSNASNRANAARAAFAAFKNPALNQANVDGKDIQALSAHAHALVSAQTPEARAAAAQQLVQAASSLQTSSNQQAPGQHRAGADRDGNLAQFVNTGQPSAGQIPARAAAQAANAQGQQDQGEAQHTGGPTTGPKGIEFTQ
ncbi:hypothetical protein ACXC9Q_14025 [Kribbella sp. CWNU-51]